MVRLGLRLALHSGREAFTRLLLTTVAVALGVAVLLGVLAEFHAFQADASLSCWECTQGAAVPKVLGTLAPKARAGRGELWNYSVDYFEGRTIERLDVAALGPGAPVPPGVSRLPGPGQYDVSPALAALLRTVPAGELGERFPGSRAGTLGQAALSGPDELAVYVGYRPAALVAVPGTQLVTTIGTAPGPQVFTPFFRYAFGVGVLAVLFPVLILIGTATRLAATRREERFAALRLVGATPRDISVIASVDSVVSALAGAILGIGLFLAVRPALAGAELTGTRYFPATVTPTAWGYLAMLVAVPAASAAASLLALRRVRISPLGVSRRTSPPPPSAWRLLTLGIGLVLFVAGLLATTAKTIGAPAYPGLLIVMIGLIVAGPWLTATAARWCARVLNGASPLLATRRLEDNPKAAFRAVRGLVLAVFLGTIAGTLIPAVESLSATPNSAALSNVLLDAFADPNLGPSQAIQGNQGLAPRAGATLVSDLRAIGGDRGLPALLLPAGDQPWITRATTMPSSGARCSGTLARVRAVRARHPRGPGQRREPDLERQPAQQHRDVRRREQSRLPGQPGRAAAAGGAGPGERRGHAGAGAHVTWRYTRRRVPPPSRVLRRRRRRGPMARRSRSGPAGPSCSSGSSTSRSR